MKKTSSARPRILVLEGLSGASDKVRRAGGEPVTVSPWDVDAVFAALDQGYVDGVLLTGGGDVDPRRYGQTQRREVYGVNETRDEVEFLALAMAREQGLPVLGICRGAQVQNVEAGGTLHQHIPSRLKHHKHSHGSHKVRALNGSRVREAFRDEWAPVVSLHHQAVAKVAPGWHASAWAPDATVEAIESDDGRCVGVQFHPEMAATDPRMQRFFDLLVRDACERAGLAYLPKAWAPKAAKKTKVKTAARPRRLKNPAGVRQAWRCFRCNIPDFDLREDFVDHMRHLHDVDLRAGVRS